MHFWFLGASSSAASESQSQEPASEEKKAIKGLEITKENGICTITINRPKKLNAITHEVSFLALLLFFCFVLFCFFVCFFH